MVSATKFSKREQRRLTAVANRLLRCFPLAEQAMRAALYEFAHLSGCGMFPFSPSLLVTVLTEKYAMVYACRLHLRQLPADWIPPELLLCAPGGISCAQAARLLDTDSQQVERRYAAAQWMLETSGRPPEEAAALLRERAVQAFPAEASKQRIKRAQSPWFYAAAGFALFDLCMLALAGGLIHWSRAFLTPPQPAPRVAAAPAAPETAASLDHLFYAVQVPDEFRLVSHRRLSRYARADYADEAGHFISFVQQVGAAPVTGFDRAAVFEPISFRGHPAALCRRDGAWDVYWFNEYYCYTLSTDLSRDAALALANSAAIAAAFADGHIPLANLPALYTQRLARENGDLLVMPSVGPDAKRLETFLAAFAAGEADFLRVSEFGADGSVLVTELQTEHGRIYCTRDTRRLRSGADGESGAEYARAHLRRENGRLSLLLERDDGAPLSLVWNEGDAA